MCEMRAEWIRRRKRQISHDEKLDSLVAHPRTVGGMFCSNPCGCRRVADRIEGTGQSHRGQGTEDGAREGSRWLDQEFRVGEGTRQAHLSFDIAVPKSRNVTE